jgi:AcrR family transcriptional regulator
MAPNKPHARHRPRLSREAIVLAAAALLDEEGIEALSARRLAAELSCEAMSLYHHVPSMSALVDELIDRALTSIPLPGAGQAAPYQQLLTMTRAYLELADKRPNTFRVMATRRWRTPAQVAYQSNMIELLMETGVSPRAALRATRLLVMYLNGAGSAMAGWRLDKAGPPTGFATARVKKLMKFSTRASVTEDAVWGLELLLKTQLPRD